MEKIHKGPINNKQPNRLKNKCTKAVLLALTLVPTEDKIEVLPFGNALFLALGSNIGTCITSILSSVGTNVNAKRTALVHLFFNLFGCLLFIGPLWIFSKEIVGFFASISSDVGQQIAVFHTLFNVCATIILLPVSHLVVKLVCKIIPDKQIEDDREEYKFKYIDNRLLSTPPIAVGNIKREIIRMSEFARENINLSIEMLVDNKAENEEIIRKNEDIINHFNKNITAYLMKLMSKELSDEDDKKVGSYYHVVSDVERVGDYAENIMEYAIRLEQESLVISAEAKEELENLKAKVNELYDYSITAFNDRSPELLGKVSEVEEEIDDIAVVLEGKHIERVKKGQCNAQVGSVYLQTVSNLERVADHIFNIAKSIKQYCK